MTRLLLASSSIYRRNLLQKLQLEFDWASPNNNETPFTDETPSNLVLRLSSKKAHSLAAEFPNHLIIGSDQVASFNEQIIGKPGNHENAIQQLSLFSGNSVIFYTGICLLNPQTQQLHSRVEAFEVQFRKLNHTQIENYLFREQPYDCAGSFKSEGLGICLFQSMNGRDHNSLIGLPLMALVDLLALEGIDILQ